MEKIRAGAALVNAPIINVFLAGVERDMAFAIHALNSEMQAVKKHALSFPTQTATPTWPKSSWSGSKRELLGLMQGFASETQ